MEDKLNLKYHSNKIAWCLSDLKQAALFYKQIIPSFTSEHEFKGYDDVFQILELLLQIVPTEWHGRQTAAQLLTERQWEPLFRPVNEKVEKAIYCVFPKKLLPYTFLQIATFLAVKRPCSQVVSNKTVLPRC